MREKISVPARRFLWLMLISSVTAVTIWYGRRLLNNPFDQWWTETAEAFSYFTILTNTVVIVMSVSLLWGHGRLHHWFRNTSVQSAICLYIFFVGLAFWFLLGGPTYAETVVDWIAEMTGHTLSPILGFVYWFVVLSPEKLQWRDPFLWLLYPIGYLIYWLFRGPLVGYYPYFFIDVDALGYAGVAQWTAILIIAFLFLGSLMLLVSRRRQA
jgi:hypothetical protein